MTLSVSRKRRILQLLACLALLVSSGFLIPGAATAAPPHPVAFTDDDFSLVSDQSPNIGPYTSDYAGFAADQTVVSRSTPEPGWMTYETDFDVTAVVVDSYVWVHGQDPALTIETSADGAQWSAPAALTQTQRTNPDAADWPYTVHEALVTEPGQRHVRITLSGTADGAGWGVQPSKVYVNSRVLSVVADPAAPSRIDGPTQISLSTATPGATIHYTIDGGDEQTYDGPFTIQGKASVVAVARVEGMTDSAPMTFNYSSAADIIVDRFGQIDAVDWPTKVSSEEDLRDDIAWDQEYYGALKPPARDSYGGDPGSGERLGLDATGWFHVGTTSDGRTTLVTPEGNQFFSLGLNVFGSVGDTYNHVAGREEIYDGLPPTSGDPLSPGWMGEQNQNFSYYIANQVRKYGQWNPDEYWVRQVDRATKWGFNSVGGFSSLGLRHNDPFPYVAHLDDVPNHEIGWSGLYDVFTPGLQQELNASMERQVQQYKDDPHLIGYMFFNEIPWARLRTAVSERPASEVASKGVLVDLLEERHGTIASFNEAWDMSADSFDTLREMSFTPRTEAAVADVDAFSELFMDKFYEVFSTAIRNADPNHMVLGDRWFGSVIANDKLRDQLATAAGKHLDVITYNYYTWDIDEERIDAIWEKSGHTPVIIGEFHYGEPTQGLTFAIRMANNPTEKGLMYRNYVEKAAHSGKIVGTHWFEYLDQAATGRWFQGYDGEAGGIGLLNVADRPHVDTLTGVMDANYSVYDLMEGRAEPYQYEFSDSQTERDNDQTTEVPRAQTPPVIDADLGDWPDGETLVLDNTDLTDGVALDGVEGRFRLAWDDDNLYLHASIDDETPMLNPNQGFDIWNGDAIELFVGPRNVDQGGGIQLHDTQIILSAEPQDEDGTITYFWYNERTDQPHIEGVVKAADGGYTLEAAISLADLGIDQVTPPQTIRFDIGFDDGNSRSRQRQYMWNGVEGNAHNRESWGRAVLVTDETTTPTPSPTPTTSATPTSAPVPTPGVVDPSEFTSIDRLYYTPGYHDANGRRWFTRCEPFSQTVRCWTSIWGTEVKYSAGRYEKTDGWVVNNLTYLPYMTRSGWGSNRLANSGEFTSAGRQWRTECDTTRTGQGACRSWILVPSAVQATQDADGRWSYRISPTWLFNNMVVFRTR